MSFKCPECGETFDSRKELSDHILEHEKEGNQKERTITIRNLREKPTSTGGTNYQIFSQRGNMYSLFTKPKGWDDLRQGDEVRFKYEKSGNYNNIVEGSIEVLKQSGKPKQPRREEKGRGGGLQLGTRDLMVKWVMESASRTLQNQEEITEEKLQMVLRNYATYAQTELIQEGEDNE